jgi:hypothetical protein
MRILGITFASATRWFIQPIRYHRPGAASYTHGAEVLREGGDVGKLVRIGDQQYLIDPLPAGDHRQNTSGRTLWRPRHRRSAADR